MKINVLQFINSFHQGGSERQAVQLAEMLGAEKNFKVFVAALDKKGVLLDELEKTNAAEIPEYNLQSFFDLNFLKQIRQCAGFLRRNEIEIVHTHDFYTNIFGILAAKYAGVPVKIASKRETGGMRTARQERFENFVFKLADAVTVNAEAVKKHLEKQGISGAKIRVIYNGVDLERLQPKETEPGKIRRALGLPPDENIKFIALVANLRHRVKNQPMLLRAARRLSKDFPDVHFVFAGEGELEKELKNLAENFEVAGKTHFLGRCRRIPDLLSISRAGVLTSNAEGFSNSILEYMSAGLPVVATRVGGASEAVIEAETGFLVEPDDDEALAEKLRVLLENSALALKMGRAGKNRIEEKFSTEAQLANVSDLYKKLLDEKIRKSERVKTR